MTVLPRCSDVDVAMTSGLRDSHTHPKEPRMPRALARFWSVAAFLGCVVAANVLTARYGMVPVGFGLIATAGTWTAGLALVARDLVQDAAGRWAVAGCVAVGAGLSYFLASPALAIASGVAFAVSELADMAVYTPLRVRGRWATAVVTSNTVGAVIDTVVFLALAGFPIWTALPGQFVAKTTATLIVVIPVVMVRALLRHRLDRQGA